MEGRRVGEYVVEGLLATGGFGEVYRVSHARLGRAGALKVLHPWLVHTHDAARRFEREALAASRIRHPNVVEIYDLGLLDGRPYLVMEMLAGVDLGRWIEQEGRLSLGDAVEIVEQLGAALAAAHRHGVVHRDLKASNVFLEEAGAGGRRRVVLVDFGIAKLLDPDAEHLTGSREVVGTPVCMAPEQIKGGEVDARADIYALGALVYHMLTGRPPFEDESATVTQYLHLSAERPRASETSRVPRAVDAVIERAMAIAPKDRHASVEELVDAFRHAAVASARGAQRTEAGVAAYVELRDGEEAGRVEALLAGAGLTIVLRGPDSLLAAAPVAGPGATVEVAAEVARVADELLRATTCGSRPATGELLVLVTSGTLSLRGDEIAGGELLRLARWGRPPGASSGVFVARSALGAATSSGADAGDFVRWSAAAAT